MKLETVRQAYTRLVESSTKKFIPLDDILASDEDATRLELIQKYNSRLMATKGESAPGHLFINGRYASMGGVRPAGSGTRQD